MEARSVRGAPRADAGPLDVAPLPARPSDMRVFLRARRSNRSAGFVVDYVMAQLFEGLLKQGDRLDREAIAQALGVSRTPVQEALVILERDGIVVSGFHRGTFVARFDESALREHVRMYGLVMVDVVAREAVTASPELLEKLQSALAEMRTAREFQTWDSAAHDFVQLITRAHDQPRIRALLTTFASLMPWTAMLTWPRSARETTRFYGALAEAFAAHDGDAAATAMRENIRTIADLLIEELFDRGVLEH